MGTTTTPTYRVEISVFGPFTWTAQAWATKHYGRPTDATLAAAVADIEASTRPEGVNAHLGETVVSSARVIRQATDEVVAAYRGPSFVAAGRVS